MVDPKARRHRPIPRSDTCIPPVDPAEVQALLLELAPLRDLPWLPLAQRVEALTTALRGGDGVGPGLVDQLRRWAGTWQHLHSDLRAFYGRHAGHPAAEAAIWRILEGGRFVGPLRGQLERLWLDDHGSPAGLSLVPHLTPTPTTRQP